MSLENRVGHGGLYAGIPICLGYLSVSFAFGIFAVESGLSLLSTVLLSMTCVTSAGQLQQTSPVRMALVMNRHT